MRHKRDAEMVHISSGHTKLRKAISANKELDPLHFISSGVACFALTLLDHLGIATILKNYKKIDREDLGKFSNNDVVQSAFSLLEKHHILKSESNKYSLTSFGEKLLDHMGSIGLIYDGYRSILSNQVDIFYHRTSDPNEFIDGEAVAHASIAFGEKFIDPIFYQEIHNINFSGTVCDLGCGAAEKLIHICEMNNVNGLGIEVNEDALELAAKNIEKSRSKNIELLKGDLGNLKLFREDVEILTQFFVLHDFPTKQCSSMFESFKKSFPNLKYIIYADVVSGKEHSEPLLPGFDYVHSLLKISPRTYQETLDLFRENSLEVLKEIPIKELPNTFIWILF